MNEAKPETREIIVDELFPHAPEILWAALTTVDLMSRWLMPPDGFEPVAGKRFTFRTTPAGAWDGRIRCEVVEVVANERLAFTWRSGDEANAGYGSLLDTVVTFTLTKVAEGTRLRVVHSGFVPTKNDTAFDNLGAGWHGCMDRLGGVIAGNA